METTVRKILLYIDSMERGGAQRVMCCIAEYLLNLGIEVLLVNDFLPDSSKAQYDIPEPIKRLYLRDGLKGNPILKNVDRIWKLRRIVRRENPDIVMSFLGRPNLRMLIATLGLKNTKIVSVRNDPNREYAKKGIVKQLARILFCFADGCVFQTREASDYFPQKVKSRSAIIRNPIAESFYKVEKCASPKNVVTVGRLEEQKNHKLLIDAFALIAEQFPLDDLYIYGEGALRNELTEHALSKGLEDRIHLPGSTQHVAEVLANSRLFVLSSDYEGMPNALMEAMAVGLPVISTDCPCGGPRELITNEKDGVLIPVRDATRLAEKMKEILSDPIIADCLASGAQNRAEMFRQEVVMQEWMGFLEIVLHSKDKLNI